MLRLGVLGLGSVFLGPYRKLIRQLEQDGQARLTAAFDVDRDKTAAVAALHPFDRDARYRGGAHCARRCRCDSRADQHE